MKTLTLLCSALALASAATTASAQAQKNIFRFGVTHVEPHASASDATGPFLLGPPSGVSLDVKNQDTAFFSYARTLDDRFEVELAMGLPPKHDVTARLNPGIVPGHIYSAFQGQTIARIRQVAPTLFLNYKFGEANSTWRPFVGVGVNYTKFDKRESTATGNALNGGPTDLQLKDSWGLALQAGVSYRLNERWSLNASVATAQVKTQLTATTAGAVRNIDIKFRPQVFILSAGYSF